jgi:hypothetical protein
MNRYWYVECVGYAQVIELEASRITLEGQDLLEVIQGGEVCLALIKRKAREVADKLDWLKSILIAGQLVATELSGFDIRIAETSALKDLLVEIWRSKQTETYRFPIIQGQWEGVDVPDGIKNGTPSFSIYIEAGQVSPRLKPELRVELVELLRRGLWVESEDEVVNKVMVRFMPHSRMDTIQKTISALAKIYTMADAIQAMSGAEDLGDILFSDGKAFWRCA